MDSTTLKCLYVAAAVLEAGGVASIVSGLTSGRRRAERFVKRRAYFGPVFKGPRGSMPNREAEQERRQQDRIAYEQKRQEEEFLALLGGTWWQWAGVAAVALGIIVGTIANFGGS